MSLFLGNIKGQDGHKTMKILQNSKRIIKSIKANEETNLITFDYKTRTDSESIDPFITDNFKKINFHLTFFTIRDHVYTNTQSKNNFNDFITHGRFALNLDIIFNETQKEEILDYLKNYTNNVQLEIEIILNRNPYTNEKTDYSIYLPLMNIFV